MIRMRELTTGQYLHLILRQRGWTQLHLAQELAASAHGAALTPNLPARAWQWRLNRVMSDHLRLSAAECEAIALALALSVPETRLLLRAADVFPAEDDITARMRAVRSDLEACPWPAYVTSYRLTHILAWNAAMSAIYRVGAGPFGPDLERGYDGRSYRPLPFATMLLDTQGPFAAAHAAMTPEMRRQLLRQQLAYLDSYWAPYRLDGEPPWMIAALRELRAYEEFDALWTSKRYCGARERLDASLDTATGVFYDTLQFAIGPWALLLDVHLLLEDPRLEVLTHVPANRATAVAFAALSGE